MLAGVHWVLRCVELAGGVRRALLVKYVVVDSVFAVASMLLCIFVAAYAYRGYAMVRERLLLYLGMAFTLISGGLLAEAAANVAALFGGHAVLVVAGDLVSLVAQLLGYLAIAYGYYAPRRGWVASIALPLLTLRVAIVAVVAFILARLAVNYVVSRDAASGAALLAFALIEASYVLYLASPYAPLLYLAAGVARLLGFSALVLVAWLAGRGGGR